MKPLRGGRNVENQNVERSERRKFFSDDQNIESQKDQNVKSIFRTSKMTYLWHLGLPNLT